MRRPARHPLLALATAALVLLGSIDARALVLCLGSDGHVAVEAMSPVAHCERVCEPCSVSDGDAHWEHPDCEDRPLSRVPVLRTMPELEDGAVATGTVARLAAEDVLGETARTPSAVPAATSLSPPTLSLIRTVTLLI